MKILLKKGQIGEICFSTISPRIAEAIKRHNKIVYITIDPNTNAKHEVERVKPNSDRRYKMKVPYQFMTPDEQQDYLHKYISEVYIRLMEHGDWFFYIYERTEQNNNLHIHGLLFSDSIQDEYSLKALQKTVASHPWTMFNMSKKKIDYMNEIVYFNDNIDFISKYFQKQQDIKKYFPDQLVEK